MIHLVKLSGLTMPVNKRNWRNKNGRPIGSGTARSEYMNGVSSIRRAARPTATGTLALIPRRSASGGISSKLYLL